MGKRLYVGNLSYSTTETDLRDAFTATGHEVAEVKLVLDRDTGRPRGFAFVEMTTDAGALNAIENLNGKDLQGRSIAVSEARERTGGGGGGGGSRGGFGGGGGGGGGRGGDRGGFGGGGGGRKQRW
jgi:RNA recognition motif-containing protein